MFALARQIPAGDRSMKAGGWLESAAPGIVLHGKTLGIVGLGRVGVAVAAMAKTIGMRVIAWSPNLTQERAVAAGAEFRSSKQALLRESDIISLHLVLAQSTANTLAAGDFSDFKPSALLINTARGPLIEESALIDALQQGRIAGAALDVYDVEPLPAEHPLRRLQNCILLPHFGYVTREIYEVMYQETAAAARNYIMRAS
jgi:phosphoglycerate dehydrogenase-like enzyme